MSKKLFLPVKNYVNLPSKSYKQKTSKKIIFEGIFKVTDEKNRIRIR